METKVKIGVELDIVVISYPYVKILTFAIESNCWHCNKFQHPSSKAIIGKEASNMLFKQSETEVHASWSSSPMGLKT